MLINMRRSRIYFSIARRIGRSTGLSKDKLSHEEVLEVGKKSRRRFRATIVCRARLDACGFREKSIILFSNLFLELSVLCEDKH
jgi:hypothetical protein